MVLDQLIRISVVLHDLDMTLIEVTVSALELTSLFIKQFLQEGAVQRRNIESLSFENKGDQKRLLQAPLHILIIIGL